MGGIEGMAAKAERPGVELPEIANCCAAIQMPLGCVTQHSTLSKFFTGVVAFTKITM